MKAVRRVWQTAQLLLREAWHLRLAWAAAGLAVALVALAALLRDLNFGAAETRFLVDAARAALGIGGVLLIALVGPALFFSGLASHVARLLFVRGVRRGEWLVAQWLVLLALCGALLAVCAASLALLLGGLGHQAAIAPAMALLARGVGPLVVLAGFSLLACAVARSSTLATLLLVAVAICAQLAPALRPLQRADGITAWFWRMADWLLPDFSVFSGPWTLAVATYAVGTSLVAVGVAVLVLRPREL